MSVAQAEQHMTSGSDRLVDQLANKIGGLGVELADVAGNVQEVAQRVSAQSERFGHLQKTAETMVSANHNIANASQAVQSPLRNAKINAYDLVAGQLPHPLDRLDQQLDIGLARQPVVAVAHQR